MKVSLFILCCLILTGCGKTKDLECSLEISNDSDELELSVYSSYTFDGKNLIEAVMTTKTKANTKSSGSSCQYFESEVGVLCEEKIEDDYLVFTVNIDGLEASEEFLISSNLNYEYEELKNVYENVGYKCVEQ